MKTIRSMTALAVLIGVLAFPLPAAGAPAAQGGLTVSVTPLAACGEVTFAVGVEGGTPPYTLTLDFGDGETLTATTEGVPPAMLAHSYATAGSYSWTVSASDGTLQGQASGTLEMGPTVTLTSVPFPPLLSLTGGQASVSLTAEVQGGTPPFTYAWTFDGATASTSDPNSGTASATYGAGGKYTAAVSVTDSCGMTAVASLAIVVEDTAAEACHPAAQWIADAVNTLFPQQSEQLYTCEDIYGFFTGGLTGSQLGFGRMRHAYALAQTIPDLTWEEILAWQLDGNGWGLLVQMNRISQAVGDVGLTELIDRFVSGENTVADFRAAARMTVRYDADFIGALDLLAGGAKYGELGQIYRAADELGVDPAVVTGYQEMGIRPVELEQAARLAERLGGDWASVLEAHSVGESWGAIRKGASGTEGGTGDVPGQGEVHGQGQGKGHSPTESEGQTGREVEARVAAQLAARYGVTAEQVMTIYTGVCAGDWACVRATLRGHVGGTGRGHNK